MSPNNGSQMGSVLSERRPYLTDEDEEKVTDLETRKTGYKNAVRALEPVARIDTELQAQVEEFEARIAKLSEEIAAIEEESHKKLEKARYDSAGVKFKQNDTLLLVPNHGTNWRSHHLQSKKATIAKQTSHRLELDINGKSAVLYKDPNRSYEPAYLVVYESDPSNYYLVDNLFVLTERTAEYESESAGAEA